MGRKIVQIIHECSLCGMQAEDGDTLWHMGREIWCEECCEIMENEDESDD